ncbi:MAG: hypothetical protein IKV16_03975 [Clostridia bacterium]|nr:hypothetical protein [Clostridia bacterium]
MERQKNKAAEKLTDKAFSRLMIASVIGILICIFCLCSTTWAWFNASSSADGNTLSASQFKLDITVLDESEATVSPFTDPQGNTVYVFDEVGTYTVKLKMSDVTTANKGFGILKVDDKVYYTASINPDNDPFIFMIEIAEAGVSLSFSSSWGYPSEIELIEIGEGLVLGNTLNSEDE